MLRWTFLIFSSKRSFLLRKSTMEVSAKNLWLQILLNRWRDSCMRFWKRSERNRMSLPADVCRLVLYDRMAEFWLTTSSSSTSTMSYALRAPQKMMQVTPSKQWIHFFLSDLWPPTSNILFTTEKHNVSPGYHAALRQWFPNPIALSDELPSSNHNVCFKCRAEFM